MEVCITSGGCYLTRDLSKCPPIDFMLVYDFLPPLVARSGDLEVSVCKALLLLITLFRFETLEIAFLFYEITLLLKGEF
jgi:hypothetical protein